MHTSFGRLEERRRRGEAGRLEGFQAQLGRNWYRRVLTFPDRLQLYPEHSRPSGEMSPQRCPSVRSPPSQWPLEERWKVEVLLMVVTQAQKPTLVQNNSPITSMPVQKDPYRYMTQSSSEGWLSKCRLATTARVARAVRVRGGFTPDEKQQRQPVIKPPKLTLLLINVNKKRTGLVVVGSWSHHDAPEHTDRHQGSLLCGSSHHHWWKASS